MKVRKNTQSFAESPFCKALEALEQAKPVEGVRPEFFQLFNVCDSIPKVRMALRWAVNSEEQKLAEGKWKEFSGRELAALSCIVWCEGERLGRARKIPNELLLGFHRIFLQCPQALNEEVLYRWRRCWSCMAI